MSQFPPFQMLVTLFERCMKRRGVKETDPFDWEKTEENNADHAGDAKGGNAAVPKSELIKKHKDIELTEVSDARFDAGLKCNLEFLPSFRFFSRSAK